MARRCTYYWAPDNRKITSKKVRQALQFAYPYKNAILAAGLIPGVNAIPATNLMPPGLPGRTPYNTTGHKAFQTDPAKAKSLLKSANAMGYEIKFLFRTDDPINIKVKDAIVKALTEAGFKATPVPTTTANYPAARDNTKEDINVRSAGWCSDWPSGATWLPTVYGSTNPDTTNSFGTNYAAFGNKSMDSKMDSIQKLPLDQQAAAWNSLDKEIAQKFFPLFPTYYTRYRSGPRIEDPGRLRRQHPRYADLEEHLDLPVIHPVRQVGQLTDPVPPGGGVRRTPCPTTHHHRRQPLGSRDDGIHRSPTAQRDPRGHLDLDVRVRSLLQGARRQSRP